MMAARLSRSGASQFALLPAACGSGQAAGQLAVKRRQICTGLRPMPSV